VFALLVPLVFLHVRYQPAWTIGLGSTGATVTLSDLAVLAAGAVGLWAGLRRGFGPLRPGAAVWIASAAFLLWIFAATVYPLAFEAHYRFLTHLVTALKFAEYALLALAAPVVLRRRVEDVGAVLAALAIWSVAASADGVLQFLGLVNEFEGRRPGQREPSFLGIHDLAALSGATLALGLTAIALGPLPRWERRVAVVAGVAGAVGLALSGAAAGVIGIAAVASALLGLAWRHARLTLRRTVAVGAVVALVAGGVYALRAADVESFLRFVGVEPAKKSSLKGASYAQRSVLAYIGTRMFLDHPVLGVGWQGASEQENYGPYLDDARRKFPDVPAYSLPSPRHPWGIQTAYVQAAAELGIVGLLAFAAFLVTGVAVAVRAALRAPPQLLLAAAAPLGWLLVVIGVWIGMGMVAGIPLVGLNWLALGLAAASSAWTARG
jgi:hypothetical protein